MKKIMLSIISIIAVTSFSFAGGDIEPAVESTLNIPSEEVTKSFTSPLAYNRALYMGLSYSYATESQRENYVPNDLLLASDDTSWDFSGMAQLGYIINQNFAVESRFTASLDDAKYDATDISAYDLTNMALYAKAMYPVAEVLSVYALLGYGQTTVDGKKEYKSDGLQWGVGASYSLNNKVSFFADYTKLALEDSYEQDGVDITTNDKLDIGSVNIGANYSF